MMVWGEIRERETANEMEIMPTVDVFYDRLLEWRAGILAGKEEADQKSIIRSNWRWLVEVGDTVTVTLSMPHGGA